MGDSASIDDQIVAAIRQISRAVELNSRQSFEQFGLTLPQLAVLREAARAPDGSIGDVARALRLSQPTVTGILDRLERRGLVSRTRDARDRRTVHVSPTVAGSLLLSQVRSPLQDRLQEGLARLADWERTMLLAALQRLAGMIDTRLERGAALEPATTTLGTDKLPLSSVTLDSGSTPDLGLAPAGDE